MYKLALHGWRRPQKHIEKVGIVTFVRPADRHGGFRVSD